MPNLDEVINYYGIHDDHIDCFICGEYLDTIDEEIHEFTKDGNKIHRIQQEDLSYDNNKDDTNNNTLSEMIDNYYNIFIHKLHIKNDKLSLFTLILNYFNDNYFTSNKIRKDDIYIIYEYLYNDYINIIQNNVLNIIQPNILEYNKFAILFKELFLFNINEPNSIKNIKNILQNNLNIPSVNKKQELFIYINKFYNNIYLYYYNNYFDIIILCICILIYYLKIVIIKIISKNK